MGGTEREKRGHRLRKHRKVQRLAEEYIAQFREMVAQLQERNPRAARMLHDAYFSGNYEFIPVGASYDSLDGFRLTAIALVGIQDRRTFQAFCTFGTHTEPLISIMTGLFKETPKVLDESARYLTGELIRETADRGLSVLVGVEFTRARRTNKDQTRIFVPKFYRFELGGRDEVGDDALVAGAASYLLHDEFLQRIKGVKPAVIRF